MFPIFICEDSKEQLDRLITIVKYYIMDRDNYYLEKVSTNPEKLLSYVKDKSIKKGIYLLDVNLNHHLTGIDLAEKIRKQDPHAKIIFITGHDESMPEMLKRNIEVLGFVQKNDELDILRKNVLQAISAANERLISTLTEDKDIFTFSFGAKTFRFDFKDVLSVETTGKSHQLIIYLTNGQYEIRGTLSELEKKYAQFFRLNRSVLINHHNVVRINYSERIVIMRNGTTIFFTKHQTKKLKKYFG